jgi:NAD-dependent DNA ligase
MSYFKNLCDDYESIQNEYLNVQNKLSFMEQIHAENVLYMIKRKEENNLKIFIKGFGIDKIKNILDRFNYTGYFTSFLDSLR